MSALEISRKPQVALPKDPGACWEFLGAVTTQGYPKKCVGGRHVTAQRWCWEMLFGPVPLGSKVGTNCGNKRCINPYHLIVRAHADAIRAGAGSVLTPGDVAEIRRIPLADRTTITADHLAAKFGCVRRTVIDVWTNSTWTKRPRPRTAATEGRVVSARPSFAAPTMKHAS